MAEIKNPWSVILAVGLLVAATLPLNAWALSTLWAWFVVPLGAPPVGIAHAAGLLIAANILRARPLIAGAPKEERDAFIREPFTKVLAYLSVTPAAVAMGWLAREVML